MSQIAINFEDRIEIDAKAFILKHPDVWELFVKYTFELIRAGHRHYSADAVLHRVRWHYSTSSAGEVFKCNNNHAAIFSRMFADAYPEHEGFFRTRIRRAV